MAIIVHSPHDGQPVKVRDQDLERAIRDSEGRIFYAVKRSDGSGYYGALTRKGSDKDEQRYLDLIEKMETARQVGKIRSEAQVHDATGKDKSPGAMRWIVLLILAGIIAAMSWYFFKSYNSNGPLPNAPQDTPDENEVPADENTSAEHLFKNDAVEIQQVNYEQGLTAEGYISTSSGLRYKILKTGTGDTAIAGRYVLINYVGSTFDGKEFDRSAPGKPVGFIVWSGEVPRGWDEGLVGMRVGEKRRLILSPELVCGPYPGIVVVPDGTLKFDIELVGILPGVRLTTESLGEGEIAKPGDTVLVNYRAYVGREQETYDDTYQRGEPTELRIGTGEVIAGWDLGVAGMQEGEKRLIEIPPYLAYGSRGAAGGVIPPGASLRYEVELVGVKTSTARKVAISREYRAETP